MEEIVLKVKDLTCGYDSSFILKDINLEVREGETFGIIGPNGSGKTTLLKTLSGLIKPVKGEVIFNGRSMQEIDLKERSRKIAVVSQNPPMSDMTVEDFVLLGRIPHYRRFQFLETKADIEIAKRCMGLTDILSIKDRHISQLSGGERQRASIARALAQQPQLLLLDEPITHLDITHQIGLLDLIRRLDDEVGLTTIMVLHDLNLASEYCDRLLLLNNGKVHKIGTPHEVLNYQIIEKVYRTVVIVKENPISHKPYVVLVPHSSTIPEGKPAMEEVL